MTDTLQTRTAGATEAAERTRSTVTYAPAVDIREAPDRIVVVADMPGVAPDGVNVTLENDVLTIEGQTSSAGGPRGHRLAQAEFSTGDYRRLFTINEAIDRDGITATIKNGVLRIVLPKAKEAQARRINVTTA